jgi:hypothetical protein
MFPQIDAAEKVIISNVFNGVKTENAKAAVTKLRELGIRVPQQMKYGYLNLAEKFKALADSSQPQRSRPKEIAEQLRDGKRGKFNPLTHGWLRWRGLRFTYGKPIPPYYSTIHAYSALYGEIAPKLLQTFGAGYKKREGLFSPITKSLNELAGPEHSLSGKKLFEFLTLRDWSAEEADLIVLALTGDRSEELTQALVGGRSKLTKSMLNAISAASYSPFREAIGSMQIEAISFVNLPSYAGAYVQTWRELLLPLTCAYDGTPRAMQVELPPELLKRLSQLRTRRNDPHATDDKE